MTGKKRIEKGNCRANLPILLKSIQLKLINATGTICRPPPGKVQ